MPDFLHIISAYHEINDFPFGTQEKELAQLLIDSPTKSILTYHPQWYRRYYFHQLITNDISLEQFMNLGDVDMALPDEEIIDMHLNPHTYREQHPALLDVITPDIISSWTADHIVIIDPLIYKYTVSQHWKIDTNATVVVL